MPTLVMGAGDGRESTGGMSSGGGQQRAPAHIRRWQARGDALQHPRTTEIESVQMSKLAVCLVGDDANRKPVRGTGARDAWQKRLQPPRELVRRQDAAHHVGLGNAWRQKVLARGLIADRTPAIVEMKLANLVDHHRGQLRIVAAGVVKDQPERKGRLRML